MKKRWLKVMLLAFIAMGFSLPAWAAQLKLHGSYKMEGRYFNQQDIVKGIYLEGANDTEANIGSMMIPRTSYDLKYLEKLQEYLDHYSGLEYSLNQAADLASKAAKVDATAAKTYDPYVPYAPIKDLVDDDAYIKHFFHLNPELVVNDRISIKADIVAYENKISRDRYGLGQYNEEYYETDVDSFDFGFRHSYDRYNIFRINYLWADFTTDFGKFILGRTP
ncbi:MAG: hypothetical protein J7J85_06745, partial [Deltaproteobacteria bacterium]|nr:hypothetical protein [Deltaproteobacteria bacterium]